MAHRAPTRIVDFDGLQGFSGAEFKAKIGKSWPGLQAQRITFPGMDARPVFPEVMARTLETSQGQEQLAELIRPLAAGFDFVGLPAMLGVHRPDKVRQRMGQLVGATLFEIPTIPPAVPGIRLRELFERELPRRGVRLEPQLKVSNVALNDSGATLSVHGALDDLTVDASTVVLATGRFLSGGLSSDRNRVSETVLNLPVYQPDGRDKWFSEGYLDPSGHGLNQAGLETDKFMRPLGENQAPVSERLFAAGAVLAHQDWVRQRCGAGLAIATAHRAVEAASRLCDLA